jgi:hypothetical protein
MKRVAPGSLHCKFSNLSAETSAFCNHAAQTAQVADEGIFRFSKGSGWPAPKMTDHTGLRFDFRRFRKTKITLYKLPNARFGASVDLPLSAKSFLTSCRPANKELNGQEKL